MDLRPVTHGTLRPDIVLYGIPYPDDTQIFDAVDTDLEAQPDLVVVVGTRLNVPGARASALKFCKVARNAGKTTVWLSWEDPPNSLQRWSDFQVREDCNKLVRLIG